MNSILVHNMSENYAQQRHQVVNVDMQSGYLACHHLVKEQTSDIRICSFPLEQHKRTHVHLCGTAINPVNGEIFRQEYGKVNNIEDSAFDT